MAGLTCLHRQRSKIRLEPKWFTGLIGSGIPGFLASRTQVCDKDSIIIDCLWLHRISNQAPIYGWVKWWQISGRIQTDFQLTRLYLQRDAVMTVTQLSYPLWYCSHNCSPAVTAFSHLPWPSHSIICWSLILGPDLYQAPSDNRSQKSNNTLRKIRKQPAPATVSVLWYVSFATEMVDFVLFCG